MNLTARIPKLQAPRVANWETSLYLGGGSINVHGGVSVRQAPNMIGIPTNLRGSRSNLVMECCSLPKLPHIPPEVEGGRTLDPTNGGSPL